MAKITSILPDIASSDVAASREFYTSLMGLNVAFDTDWYVLLQGSEDTVQLALVDRHHDSVPADYRKPPAGVFITFEVDDATELWARAQELGLPVALPLKDEEFGQRHFMVVDPDGLLVDVVQTLFVPEEI